MADLDKIIREKNRELNTLIHNNREVQERDRFKTITKLYGYFMEDKTEIESSVYLNKALLEIVVGSYFDDIYKYQLYSQSESADRHKQGAYMIKWISKIRPIQILPEIEATRELLFINNSFALFAGFSALQLGDLNLIKTEFSHFYNHLLYETQYRTISGKAYATLLYAIEEIAKAKK